MSQRDTKDNENNPPSPPFTKGGESVKSPFGKRRAHHIPPLEQGDTGGFSDEVFGHPAADIPTFS